MYEPAPVVRLASADVPCLLLLLGFYLLPQWRLLCGTALFLLLSVRFGRAPARRGHLEFEAQEDDAHDDPVAESGEDDTK